MTFVFYLWFAAMDIEHCTNKDDKTILDLISRLIKLSNYVEICKHTQNR